MTLMFPGTLTPCGLTARRDMGLHTFSIPTSNRGHQTDTHWIILFMIVGGTNSLRASTILKSSPPTSGRAVLTMSGQLQSFSPVGGRNPTLNNSPLPHRDIGSIIPI